MEVFKLNYEYVQTVLQNIATFYNYSFGQTILFISMLLMLLAMFALSRKIINLENVQFKDIDDITSYSRLIDEEIGTLKKEQDQLNNIISTSNRKPQIESEGKLFENAPYSQAVQLAKRGYARDDIISLCSLTESEVELILALHSSTKAA